MKPYYEDDSCVIYHGDCRELLTNPLWQVQVGLPTEAVMVTDPPYGTGLAPRGGATAGSLDLDSAEWPEWDQWDTSWADVWSGPMAVFCGIKRVFELGRAIKADGLLIYVKSNPNPLGSSFEPCVTRGFAVRGRQHIVVYNAFNGQVHPTQKPLELMQWILNAAPEGIVLDPFMGSGTTLRAAKDLGRKAIGIEIEERYCAIAAERLGQEVLPLGEAA